MAVGDVAPDHGHPIAQAGGPHVDDVGQPLARAEKILVEHALTGDRRAGLDQAQIVAEQGAPHVGGQQLEQGMVEMLLARALVQPAAHRVDIAEAEVAHRPARVAHAVEDGEAVEHGLDRGAELLLAAPQLLGGDPALDEVAEHLAGRAQHRLLLRPPLARGEAVEANHAPELPLDPHRQGDAGLRVVLIEPGVLCGGDELGALRQSDHRLAGVEGSSLGGREQREREAAGQGVVIDDDLDRHRREGRDGEVGILGVSH